MGIDLHKWATAERTQVFPVRPYLSMTLVRTTMAAAFVTAGVVSALLVG